MNKLIKSTIAGAALLVAPLSHAALVTDWDFTVTLEWDSSVFGTGSGLGADPLAQTFQRLVWGSTTGYVNTGAASDIGTTRSALIISNPSVNGVIQTDGPSVNTNLITHFNNPISADFATLTSAVLKSTLSLTPLSPAGSPLTQFSTTFDIKFIETANQTPCQPTSVSVCDDIFVISNNALNAAFVYNEFNYFISIFETSNRLNPLDPAVCTAAGASTECLGFQTQESQNTPAQFAFVITSEPVRIVAAPGVIGLMGLGLVALAGIRRRRQAS